MLKLEIDEKFEELSYLYDLFENITRIDYVPLEYRKEIKQLLIKAYKDGNQEFEKIHEKLKRLETLEKENKELIVNKNVAQAVAFDQKREILELKDQISYLQEEFEGSQSAYEWSQAQNSILKLKNQELEEENQKLKKEYNLLDTTMESDDRIICELLKEKEKLKKTIEVLKDILNLNVTQDKHNNYFLDGDIITEITKEQYDLLNEVFGNDRT